MDVFAAWITTALLTDDEEDKVPDLQQLKDKHRNLGDKMAQPLMSDGDAN